MVDGKNILPTSINSALLVSRDGTIWLGTGNGLININIHTKKTYIYTSKHGLPSDILPLSPKTIMANFGSQPQPE